MEGEQFSLCWNNFHSNLSSGFNSLLKDEDLVDVTLAAGGRFMKAHKTVLSVCSPFFKELFRANPSKHPIVILPDVNYNALCNLLQFMYQGEVSVSQEEIPGFMRVAEMLKVKGLTDNSSSSPPPSSSESNGFASSSSRSPYNLSTDHQRQIMKRPRPVKKVIKPLQPLRPIESPKPPHSPAKKPHLDNVSELSIANKQEPEQEYPQPLIKPKTEPIEDPETNDLSLTQKFDENNLDLSTMLDTKLGESSKWNSSEIINKPQDSSTPGTLQCILGRRGNPRLIVDGYVFYKKSVYKGKAFWYCKNSRAPEKCQAVCWTMNGNIVKWPYMHTHPVIPDVFNPDEDTEVPIQNLQEVLWQTSYRGNFMFLRSGKGQLVLIHEGHIYIHCDKILNQHIWVCVKKKTLNCEGCLRTLNGPVLLSYTRHNHPPLQDVIQRLQVPSSSVSPELLL